MKKISLIIILSISLVFTCGCDSPADETSIISADLYLDPDGTQLTDIYQARDIFYFIITLDQPEPDMTLRASWVASETSRLAPNTVLKIDEIIPSSSQVVFKLENSGNFWPTGQYKVFLYLDGKEYRVIEFEVYHDYFSE